MSNRLNTKRQRPSSKHLRAARCVLLYCSVLFKEHSHSGLSFCFNKQVSQLHTQACVCSRNTYFVPAVCQSQVNTTKPLPGFLQISLLLRNVPHFTEVPKRVNFFFLYLTLPMLSKLSHRRICFLHYLKSL